MSASETFPADLVPTTCARCPSQRRRSCASAFAGWASRRRDAADLVLRIPVANVEKAIIQLSMLGTVLDQHVSIVDLEQTVRQQRDRIMALRVRIATIAAALRRSLPADVWLRLQFRLDDARCARSRRPRATRRPRFAQQHCLASR